MKATVNITYYLVSVEHIHHVQMEAELSSLDSDEVYNECLVLLGILANIEHISVYVPDTNIIMEYKYNEG